jgi:hypothetical protein
MTLEVIEPQKAIETIKYSTLAMADKVESKERLRSPGDLSGHQRACDERKNHGIRMNEVKTTLHGSFPGKQRRKNKPSISIDPITLSICNDELPAARAKVAEHKYDELFDSMTPGQALKCESKDVGRISGAMRDYIERHKLRDHIVRTTKNYEDTGTGRVWLLFVGRQLMKAA